MQQLSFFNDRILKAAFVSKGFSYLVFVVVALFGGVSAAPKMSFEVAPRHSIGVNTIQTRLADLDGDGSLDVAAVNGGQGNPEPTLTLLFGNGNGGFGSPVVLPSYMIGHTLAVGDLNGDGRPDIVAASFYQNSLAVFLNQGNRDFAGPFFSTPPNGGEFFDLAIADFDGDGRNDVVALEDQIDQRLRFFHYGLSNVLTVFASINQLETGTSYERTMAVGDVNSDGRPDIVFAGGGPFGVRNISFVYGQPVGGTLSLTYGFGVEDKTVGVSVSDLDADGDKDLAIAFLDTTTPTRHSLQVFRNNGTGAFTAVPKIFLEYPFPPQSLTIGDFNNDGKQDLAALVSSVYDGGIMVMVANGNGDCTYTGDRYYAVAGSSYIFSADLNNDNKIDLITASSFLDQTDYIGNNTVSVLFNRDLQSFKAPLVKLWGPNLIDAADFNNDGYKDMISSWTTMFNNLSGADVSINDQHGGFFEEVSYTSPAALSDMKAGDFNGDGNADALTAHAYNSRRLAVYFGNGSGTLETAAFTSFTQPLNKIIVGDFNLDGKDDVFVVDSTGQGFSMLSLGNGTFTMAQSVTLPDASGRVQKGDFNGDHKLDLLVSGNGDIRVWINDGTGQFLPTATSVPGYANIVVGDFNGDEKLDFAGTVDEGIKGVLGDGDGGFTSTFYRPIEGTYSITLTKSMVAADFDQDGYDDIAMIMTSNAFGNLIIIPSGGSTPSWKAPVFPGAATASRTLVVGDFNNDGKPDLEWLGDNSRGVIYNNTLTAATVSGRVVALPRIAKALATLTDVNGMARTVRVGRGRFQFDNVPLGAVYTVAVHARGYSFVPQTVYVDDNVTLPDFVPSGGSKSDEKIAAGQAPSSQATFSMP